MHLDITGDSVWRAGRIAMFCALLAAQGAIPGTAVAAAGEAATGECPGEVPRLLPRHIVADPVRSVRTAIALGSEYAHCQSAVEEALRILEVLESVSPDDIDSRRARDYLRFGRHWRAVLERNRALEEQINALKDIEQQMNQREELREFP